MSIEQIVRDPRAYGINQPAAPKTRRPCAIPEPDDEYMQRQLRAIWNEFNPGEAVPDTPQPEQPAKRPDARTWTSEELKLLRRHYRTKGAEWVAAKLGRSRNSVYSCASKLKISVYDRKWPMPPDKELWLRRHWHNTTVTACAKHFGVCRYQVYRWARALGLPIGRKNKKL